MDAPDVVLYLDYRAFLRDWFAARKGRPSVRGFAKRAKCSAGLVSSSAWSGRRRSVTTALTAMYALTFLAMVFGPDAIHGGLMRVAVVCIVAWVIVNAIWAARPVEAG